jgi:acyl-coenzyme A synthetase/AMP-(fatty) acid ligase
MDLAKLVVYSARRYEQEPAIGFAGGVVTYRALMGATAAAAEVLETLRLPSRSLVVLDIRSPVHHVAMIYALALCGLRSGSVSGTNVLERTGPRPALLLTDREDLASTRELPVRRIDGRWFAHDESRPVDYQALLGKPGFDDPDEVFRLIYSSGTTGRPKCVGLTNRSLEVRISHAALQAPYRSGTGAILNTMGFSTIIGTMMPFHAPANGALLCFAGSGGEVLQMIRAFGVSYLSGSVAQLQGVMQALGDEAPPPSLRTVRLIGSRLAPPQLREMRARLANHVISVYGSTEMGRVTNAEPADLERDAGAVGWPMPFVAMEVVDEGGRPLPAGRDGVIRVRTDELAVYVDESGTPVPMTAADGWFYPGDVGHFEADGLLVVTGRTSEIINRGGVVVAPEAIEDVLRLDPRFADLAVVGVPNVRGIEEIWAAVVAVGPVDGPAVIAAARATLSERAPDRVIVVEAIPRNDNGKVMRHKLRELLLAAVADGRH